MPDICAKDYIAKLHMMGEHDIAEYLRILNAERDAAVSFLEMWPCDSCRRKRRSALCETCARNRVKISKGYALKDDMYKWMRPEDV